MSIDQTVKNAVIAEKARIICEHFVNENEVTNYDELCPYEENDTSIDAEMCQTFKELCIALELFPNGDPSTII